MDSHQEQVDTSQVGGKPRIKWIGMHAEVTLHMDEDCRLRGTIDGEWLSVDLLGDLGTATIRMNRDAANRFLMLLVTATRTFDRANEKEPAAGPIELVDEWGVDGFVSHAMQYAEEGARLFQRRDRLAALIERLGPEMVQSASPLARDSPMPETKRSDN